MTFRFVHSADVHLDSPLRTLALRDADLAALIGDATRQAFARIVDLCLDERVDALLLAGDLYDGDQTSMKTARFLSDQLRRLHEAGIPALIIRGNHDAMSRITRELALPPSATVFGDVAEVVELHSRSGQTVAIHGLSFRSPQAPDSLLPRYGASVPGMANIGLMHTSLGGAPGHDQYAPCSVAALQETGFAYWALGHIHARQAIEGATTIVMPGMPQGRDVNEAGPKSATLAVIGPDGRTRIEARPTGVAQFERVELDVAGVEDWPALAAAIGAALRGARATAESEQLVVRLRLGGATPLHWLLRRDADRLRAEAEAQADAAGRTWIEKVEVDCRPPGLAAPSADPTVELRALVREQVAADPAFAAEALAALTELQAALPAEARGALGDGEEAQRRILETLTAEGVDDVLARLRSDAGDRG
jgi:DNA repair exonuclease SbcCD nuclease subunit